ncbi:PD-(D/E)XK nuclease family protein [Ammoniphilus sp. 3BR4]|uniref:PD-(D/E)XK nuclease family protein n=1 Tax=Ammoniphilus sp. 3BR4 TaxID=3158265 RepID=UPI003467D08B
MRQLALKWSKITEIAYTNRLKSWHKLQQKTGQPVYYVLPSKKWVRVAQKRQSGVAFATFYDMEKWVHELAGEPYFEITDEQRRILIQEIMLREHASRKGMEETKNRAVAYSHTYGQLKRMAWTLDQLPPRLQQMAAVFNSYEEKWLKQGFFDPENFSIQSAQATSFMPIGHLVIDGFFDLNPLQYQLLQSIIRLNIPVTVYLPQLPGEPILTETAHRLKSMGFLEHGTGPRSKPMLKHQRVIKATTQEEEIHGVLDLICQQAGEEGFSRFGVLLADEENYLDDWMRIADKRSIPIKQPSSISLSCTQLFRLLAMVLDDRDYRDTWEKLEVLDSVLRLLFVTPQQYTNYKRDYLSGDAALPEEVESIFHGFIGLRSQLADEDTLENYLMQLVHFLEGLGLPAFWRRHLESGQTELLQRVCTEWKAYDQLLGLAQDKREELHAMGLMAMPVYYFTFKDWFMEGLQKEKIYQDRSPVNGLSLYSISDVGLFSGEQLFILGMNDGVFPNSFKLQGYFQESDLEHQKFPYGQPDKATFQKMQDVLFRQLSFLAPYLTFSYVVGVDEKNPLLPSKYIKNRKVKVLGQARAAAATIPRDAVKALIAENRKYKKELTFGASGRMSRMANGEYVFYHEQDKLEKLAYHAGLKRTVKEFPSIIAEAKIHLDRLETGSELLTAKWVEGQQAHYSGTVTVTALERYAACGFKYAMEDLLQVGEPLQRMIELDVKEKGSAQHRFIEQFYENLGLVNTPFSHFTQNGLQAQAEETLIKTFQTLWNKVEEKNSHLSAIQLKSERDELWRNIRKWWSAERYYFWQNEELHEMLIAHLEKEIMKELHIELDGTQTTLMIRGKIDRVDWDGTGFTVYDYKSGKSVSIQLEKEATNGLKLQLLMYIWALEEEFGGARAYGGSYISMKDPGRRASNAVWDGKHAGKGSKFKVSGWANKEKDMDANTIFNKYGIKKRIGELWKGMQSDFSVKPLRCSKSCVYKPVCRITKSQLEESEV